MRCLDSITNELGETPGDSEGWGKSQTRLREWTTARENEQYWLAVPGLINRTIIINVCLDSFVEDVRSLPNIHTTIPF